MFCWKMSDNLNVKTHYRTLRSIYDTQTRLNEELLDLSGKKKIHKQNLLILTAEVCKCFNNGKCFNVSHGISLSKKQPYNLRNMQLLELS